MLLSSTTSQPTLITGKLLNLHKSGSQCFSYDVTYHVMKTLNVIGHRGYKGFWKQTMMASTGFCSFVVNVTFVVHFEPDKRVLETTHRMLDVYDKVRPDEACN